MTMLEPKRR